MTKLGDVTPRNAIDALKGPAQKGLDSASTSGTVYLWTDKNFYLGPALTSEIQVSYCVKLYIATHGTFDVRSTTGRWQTYESALLPIGTAHEMRGNGGHIVSLRWAPHTVTAQKLMTVLPRNQVSMVPSPLIENMLPRLRICLDHGCGVNDALQLLDDAEYCAGKLGGFQNFDPRILEVLEQVRYGTDGIQTAAEAARSVNLSLGRFIHLFFAQTGLTFRRYVLGQRLQRSLSLLSSSKSMTEVAHQSGFADGAHFSRTAQMFLGCSPTMLRAHNWVIHE
jgi:AraC family transcriptional regulator